EAGEPRGGDSNPAIYRSSHAFSR
ncbi:MAG: hypothetical protein K0S99_3437, partial [Thermomicrobiales bacterium]|nr:hypothetical protein [Thermomicrobiales bacterium]